MVSSYKGLTLFTDVDDLALRNHNRCKVMANLFEDNMDKSRRVSKKGLAMILGYFKEIPAEERQDVYSKFSAEIASRGLTHLH